MWHIAESFIVTEVAPDHVLKQDHAIDSRLTSSTRYFSLSTRCRDHRAQP